MAESHLEKSPFRIEAELAASLMVEGGLHIVGNIALLTTEGLEALVLVGGPLRFSENHLIVGLEGLRGSPEPPGASRMAG